jgi:hypothetical protein
MDEIKGRLTGDPDRPVGLPPGIDSDETVLVSRRVVGGAPVLFAWRDQPDDDDSGWTLLAGTEPDAFLEDRNKFVSWTVGEVLERDPTLALLLGSPPDSTYERESIDELWVELVENDDA